MGNPHLPEQKLPIAHKLPIALSLGLEIDIYLIAVFRLVEIALAGEN